MINLENNEELHLPFILYINKQLIKCRCYFFSAEKTTSGICDDPLGIDVEKPRFSWQMDGGTDERGLIQTARQIIVTDEAGTQVWDSHKITDDKSLNIEYAGLSLRAATRYLWTVRVWHNKNREVSASSWFETGLMSSDRAY
ncbi:hypothetical protein [Bacteroides acidifaciens]|uniref:glycoside hydrolase family 78 protein n=1 Tax=Bacteroides acidifaciens TaxID=85831 RepID=UPI00293BE9EE|nr:hypothetical protein [Bacteroides acidifaciens]